MKKELKKRIKELEESLENPYQSYELKKDLERKLRLLQDLYNALNEP